MAAKSSSISRVLIIAAISAAMIGWHFWLVPARERQQEYSGVIVEVSRSAKLLRASEPGTHRRRHDYNHYWHLRLDDGTLKDVLMPHTQWRHGEEGAPVIKRAGERWPVINTEQHRASQEARREAREILIDQFRGD